MKQLLVNAEVDVDGTVKLSGKDYHYLATVLRKRIGDIVILDLPSCGTVAAEIIDIRAQKKELDLQIKTGLEGLTQPPPFEIVLLQWLIRGQKMDSVIRQATELGVSRIIPIAGEFSLIKEENEKQTERRRRIIKEARQQSGSVIQTEISSVQTLDCALKNLNTAYQKSSIVKLLFTEKKIRRFNAAHLLEFSPENCYHCNRRGRRNECAGSNWFKKCGIYSSTFAHKYFAGGNGGYYRLCCRTHHFK
ncbi:RsmE family RNA methyltransferase [Treponema phagedenis]|uniref:RsmE family RNA methyltransferase n=1 Tax=Treponema phagedenis TaxID=162 RepID=UPI0011EF2A41|nr:RsmE family RNA methyltransferase [Treponema phagedenis]TYT78838.1 RsmE family RNA methyltransferase [Treponema phagedenis]